MVPISPKDTIKKLNLSIFVVVLRALLFLVIKPSFEGRRSEEGRKLRTQWDRVNSSPGRERGRKGNASEIGTRLLRAAGLHRDFAVRYGRFCMNQ